MNANNDLFQVVFLIDEQLWARSTSDDSVLNLDHLIRNCVLKILTHFGAPKPLSCQSENCSPPVKPRLEWGVKFFSSSRTYKTVRDKPVFCEFTLKNLEEFELELKRRLSVSSSACYKYVDVRNFSATQNEETHDVHVFDAVKKALRTVIYDFPWDKPDITSPVKSVHFTKTGKKSESFQRKSDLTDYQKVDNSRRNFVFVIGNCPLFVDECDLKFSCMPTEVLKAFLPSDVRQQLVQNLGVRLFWINVGNYYRKKNISSNSLVGPEVIDDALQTVGGRLIPASALTNPGTFSSTYIGNLLCCCTKECYCSSSGKVVYQVHSETENETSELSLGNPAVPIFPLSSVMDYYTRWSCKSVQDISALLHLTSDLNCQQSLSFNVHLHSVFNNTNAMLLDKIVHRQAAGCPCCPYKEQQHPVSNICLISVATAAARSAQGECFHSDETHLVTGYQKCQSKLSGTVYATCDLSDLGSCQFEDLLLLLTRSRRVLLLKSVDGHPQSCQAVLQPLSLTTATLTFLSGAYDTERLAVEGIISELMEVPSNLSTDVESALPQFFDRDHSLSNTQFQLLHGFNPSVLEAWYSPESCTEAADSIISSLAADAQSQLSIKCNDEKQLLKQLRLQYTFDDGAQSANSAGFHSPRSKRYMARQLRETGRWPSGQTLSLETKPTLQVVNSDNLLAREPVTKLSTVIKTPVKKVKSASNTPAKATKRTPRRTPRKRSSRTPRKSTRLTPGKARPVARRTPAKSSGALWRANLIIQKSREAMMAKNTCAVKDKELMLCKTVNQMISNEQFTTTGWQDISSEEALIAQLRITYDRVIEGEGTPLIGAKSIVTSSMHFYRNSGQEDIPRSTCAMLCEHFLLKLPGLHAKYKGLEDIGSKASKLTEYQLQVLLRMEMEAECGDHFDVQESKTSNEHCNEIVRILQAMSFIKDPGFLSTYLKEALLVNYNQSAARLLYQIYSELMLPIPIELEHLRTPEEADSADQSVPMPSINPSSSNFALSNGIRSGENQTNAGRPRKLYRSVTFTQPTQRQIQVPIKKSQVPTPARRSTRIASVTKTKVNPPADASETKKVRRMLFDGSEADRRLSLPSSSIRSQADAAVAVNRRTSDSHRTPKKSYRGLKMKVVSETPAHKQGDRLQMKLELRQKRLSIDPSSTGIIAESPLKHIDDNGSQSHTARIIKSSQLMKGDSFYSGGQSQNPSKYTKLEQRMTQRVCSPPAETIASNYVVGSWLTSPRRITPKALFGALLSPSPDKSVSQELRISLQQPTVIGTPSRKVGTPCRLVMTSPIGMLSPSRSTRSKACSIQAKNEFDEVILSPKIVRMTSNGSSLSHDSPLFISRTKKKHAEVDQVINQCNDEVFAGSRRRIAFIQLSQPTAHVPSSKNIFMDELAVDRQGLVCCSNLSIAATPVPNDKRQIKTPDSLDKWPRKKNRFLISRSPAHASSACRSSLTADAEESNIDPVVSGSSMDLRRTANMSSLCAATANKLSETSHPSNDISRAKTSESMSVGYRNLVTVAAQTLKRKFPEDDVNDPTIGTRHQTMLTDVNIGKASGSKYFNLFGTDTDDSFGAKQSSPTALVTGATDASEENEHVIFNGNDCKRVLRGNSTSRKRSAKSRWSSGFSSGSHVSFSERSSSPVFPTFKQRSKADDIIDRNVVADLEVSLSGQPSPVFERKLHTDVVLKNSSEPNSCGKAERILLQEAGKSFSPSITDRSLMHLMSSPLLDVVSGKCKASGSNKSSSTRRCLEQQLRSSVNGSEIR